MSEERAGNGDGERVLSFDMPRTPTLGALSFARTIEIYEQMLHEGEFNITADELRLLVSAAAMMAWMNEVEWCSFSRVRKTKKRGGISREWTGTVQAHEGWPYVRKSSRVSEPIGSFLFRLILAARGDGEKP